MESSAHPSLKLALGVLLVLIALLGPGSGRSGLVCVGTHCDTAVQATAHDRAPGHPCVNDHACGGGGAIAHVLVLPVALGLLVLLLPGRRMAPARIRRLRQRLLASGPDHPPRRSA
jgi:hypothetical protein